MWSHGAEILNILLLYLGAKLDVNAKPPGLHVMTEGGVRQVEVEAKADFESTLAQGQLPCYAMAGIEVPPNKPLSGYKVHWSITQPVTGAGTGQLLRVATNYGQFFMGGGNQAQITDGSGKAKVLLDVASERSPGSGDLQHKTVVVRATLDKDDFPFKLGDLMGVRAPGFALSKSWDLVLSREAQGPAVDPGVDQRRVPRRRGVLDQGQRADHRLLLHDAHRPRPVHLRGHRRPVARDRQVPWRHRLLR